MKLKKAMAFVTTMLGISCLSINAMAAEQVILPIKAENVSTITGYIAEVTFNAEDLTPVLSGEDLLGDEQYAQSNLSSGYLSADLVEPGKLVIGWADKEQCDITRLGNLLANVVFNVNESTLNTETTVNTKLYQIASKPDVMYDDEITYSENFVIKDKIESGDAVEIVDSTDVYNPDIIALPGVPPTNKE